MCGIIGIASNVPVEGRHWLKSGRDAMIHRGPDDAGEWWSDDGRVGLGHRRLAIIDLSPAGHQPMQDTTERFTIVFNGEIYNFKEVRIELQSKGHMFRSHSDTEVILAAYREWGVDCLAKLNGMFSFALHDSKTQTLFLARDRVGEKPLFYTVNNRELRFASELKGLMADPAFSRRVDSEALDCYLAMGYIAGERCMLQGVNKLPAGHGLLFNCITGASKVWRYWTVPEMKGLESSDQVDEKVLLDELETLLEDAVRRQMMAADVPVGILLSGGLDSSLVTAMAVRSSEKVKTFTVGFSGFGKYDESKHARLVSRYFGTEHTELQAGNIGPDILPQLVRQFDEPMVDSSMIPTYLVSQLVRQHCTVALGGDGGDELFGGYIHYNRLLWMQQKFGSIPIGLRKIVSEGANLFLPVGSRGRYWLQTLGCDLNHELPLNAVLFDGLARRQLMDGSSKRKYQLVAEGIRGKRLPQTADLLRRATQMDFENYLIDDVLVKLDRASMLNSLEVRAPLLDYRMIEFAFGKVPSSLKTTIDNRKIILKKLATRVLPPEFDKQRKQGFSIPLADWLKNGPWRELFHDILLDKQCLFDRKTVAELLRGQDLGRSNSERLFSLVLFELWRREYGIEV